MVVLTAIRGWGEMGTGIGRERGVNRRIFWSNTSHPLATSSEASTSGCHGSAESDSEGSTKSCGQTVRIGCWLLTGVAVIGEYFDDTQSSPYFFFCSFSAKLI